MKITHVITNLGSGGAEKLVSEMAPLMHSKCDEVEVVVCSEIADVYSSVLQEHGIKVSFLGNSHLSPLLVFKIIKHLKNTDVVYTHTFYAQLWTAFASLFLPKSIKFITTEHSTHNRRRDLPFFYYIDKWMYSRYETVIAITEKVKSNLMKHLKIAQSSKFVVIENGINLENAKSSKAMSRTQLSYSESDKLLVMVARFSDAKDHKTLIKAIVLLPEIYKLLLVGDGPLKRDAEELSNELDVENRVSFLGFRRDIPELLKMCDVSIVSSHWEGFGLVAVEGMAAGLPVIASDVDGLNDVVRGAGVLFEKGNVKQLAQEIEKLGTQPDYYENIKNKCTERAEHYSIRKMTDGYLKLAKGIR